MASSTGTLNRTGTIATWGHNPKEASCSATSQSRNGKPSSTYPEGGKKY